MTVRWVSGPSGSPTSDRRSDVSDVKEQLEPEATMSGGKPPDPKLIDMLAELKMIYAMQRRVNSRTEMYGKKYKGEQAVPQPCGFLPGLVPGRRAGVPLRGVQIESVPYRHGQRVDGGGPAGGDPHVPPQPSRVVDIVTDQPPLGVVHRERDSTDLAQAHPGEQTRLAAPFLFQEPGL